MDIFDSPEFIATHQARGGSPLRSLDCDQQADLLSALRLGVFSIPSLPGFNENDNRSDADVKRPLVPTTLYDITLAAVSTAM